MPDSLIFWAKLFCLHRTNSQHSTPHLETPAQRFTAVFRSSLVYLDLCQHVLVSPPRWMSRLICYPLRPGAVVSPSLLSVSERSSKALRSRAARPTRFFVARLTQLIGRSPTCHRRVCRSRCDQNGLQSGRFTDDRGSIGLSQARRMWQSWCSAWDNQAVCTEWTGCP